MTAVRLPSADGNGGDEIADPGQLGIELAGRIRSSMGGDDVVSAIAAVTSSAVSLGLADFASVTERFSDRLESLGSTAPLTDDLDALQYTLREGPCVDAVFQNGLVVAADVGRDARWPRWGPRAADAGAGSIVAVHLYTSGDAIGALNLYRREPREYGAEDLERAHVAGTQASMVLAHYSDGRNLRSAIESHRAVGQAQGILMQRFGIDAAGAFAVLRRFSQDHNVKLGAVAAFVVARGELPSAAEVHRITQPAP